MNRETIAQRIQTPKGVKRVEKAENTDSLSGNENEKIEPSQNKVGKIITNKMDLQLLRYELRTNKNMIKRVRTVGPKVRHQKRH